MPKCKVHAISVTSNNFTTSGNYCTAVNIINSLKFAIPFRLKKVLILGSGALGRVVASISEIRGSNPNIGNEIF